MDSKKQVSWGTAGALRGKITFLWAVQRSSPLVCLLEALTPRGRLEWDRKQQNFWADSQLNELSVSLVRFSLALRKPKSEGKS